VPVVAYDTWSTAKMVYEAENREAGTGGEDVKA
jgi:hypothetical protein